MGSYRKPIQIVILLGVLLLGGYAVGKALFASSDSYPKVGGKPPEFTLNDLQGQSHSLADYKGKALVINFWGTFCPECVEEMPAFSSQYEKWNADGLEVLAINLSEGELAVNNFTKRFNLPFTVLRDMGRKIERAYGLRLYPTTFFVKPDGTIMDIYAGGMTEEQIDVRIARLMQY